MNITQVAHFSVPGQRTTISVTIINSKSSYSSSDPPSGCLLGSWRVQSSCYMDKVWASSTLRNLFDETAVEYLGIFTDPRDPW